MKTFACIIGLLLVMAGCQTDVNYAPSYTLPEYAPVMAHPSDNESNPNRVALGERLFFEQALSVDSSLSCGTCHKPHLAFSDDQATTKGVFGRRGKRNVPTLTNVGYAPYFTREGGVPTLEMQVLVPIQEHNEFGFNIVDIVDRLQSDSLYQQLSNNAYGRPLDAFVLVRALAAYERSLVSAESSFDQFYYQGKEDAISAYAKSGWALFKSERLGCTNCHNGFDFTNYAFENNGLYEVYKDEGRFRLTGNPDDKALFKVPSLRNIALTRPYMHDGSLQSLEDVIEHYNSGGRSYSNKSEHLKPLNLNHMEKMYLLAFLESLTDHTFIEKHKKENK